QAALRSLPTSTASHQCWTCRWKSCTRWSTSRTDMYGIGCRRPQHPCQDRSVAQQVEPGPLEHARLRLALADCEPAVEGQVVEGLRPSRRPADRHAPQRERVAETDLLP